MYILEKNKLLFTIYSEEKQLKSKPDGGMVLAGLANGKLAIFSYEVIQTVRKTNN